MEGCGGGDRVFPTRRVLSVRAWGDSPNTASEEINREYRCESPKPATGFSLLRRAFHPDLPYRIGRFGKHFVFDHDAPAFKASASLYRQIEKSKVAKKTAHAAEQMMKVPLYGCRDCGDCSLPDIGELMPGIAVREESAQRSVWGHTCWQVRDSG